MAKFVLVYHGRPAASHESTGQKERFMEWIDSVGTALVSPANPFGPSKLVTTDGVADVLPAEALSGYSVVEVDDLEAALDIVKRCPFLEVGSIEVAQLMEMGPGK
ncbi:MAG: YciI family protein [Trueperaceae bacterium]